MSLKIKVGKIQLKNPLMLAAGVLGTSYSSMNRIYQSGFGATVSKSIGLQPNPGYKNPSILLLPETHSALNAVGLANPGVHDFVDKMQTFQEDIATRLPIIYSIYGKDVNEITQIIEALNVLEPLAFELNVSCPHGGGHGGLSVCHDDELFLSMVKNAKKQANCPIWVKLSPNARDITSYADIAVEGGADALVAINTLKALTIDIDTFRPILANKKGGLSGQAIKPVGVRAIYDLYAQFNDRIPLIGVGGISTADDIIEYMLAGASGVQLGTVLAYVDNFQVFTSQLLEALQEFLAKKQMTSLKELVGKAHEF